MQLPHPAEKHDKRCRRVSATVGHAMIVLACSRPLTTPEYSIPVGDHLLLATRCAESAGTFDESVLPYLVCPVAKTPLR